MSYGKGQTIYAQGDATDALFVIQLGTVILSAKSHEKEAILDVLGQDDFIGKDSLAGQPFRSASAKAITDCSLLRIEKKAMLLALTRHVKLANMFWRYLLARNIRYQQDLVDQHCSRSEKRLARILLLLSHLDEQEARESTIPNMSHETLAEMVGTTRSRICFFMRQFREAGFVDYGLKSKVLRVHRTLLAFCSQ